MLDDLFRVSKNVDYYALPSQVNQQAMKQAAQSWKSYFELQKKWNKNPSSLTGKPKLPHYRKSGGRFDVIFPSQICKIKEDGIVLS